MESTTMETTIARLNIEHFGRKLAEETDEAKRRTLLFLLAEEETKLAQLTKLQAQGVGRR